MRRGAMTRRLPMTLLLLAAGCGSHQWQRVETTPQHRSSYPRVQIWSRDTVLVWREVLISPDSVSGIPYQKGCTTSCRRSVPRAAVDSILVDHHDLGPGEALVMAALGLGMLIGMTLGR
jgi:hypothetical protein